MPRLPQVTHRGCADNQMSSALAVSSSRVRIIRNQPHRRPARYVLYWMVTARRLEDNFGLQHACWWAHELDLPVLVFEPLRIAYPWASDRLHAFVLEGMAGNAAAAREAGITYFPYVEPTPGAGKGLLAALAADAAVVVTDDYPTFFLPRMLAAAGRSLDCRLEAVDGNGLVPMREAGKVYPTAYAFRRYLQQVLPKHLTQLPVATPLEFIPARAAPLADALIERWPAAAAALLRAPGDAVAGLPVDHGVAPSTVLRGGHAEARGRLDRFLAGGLSRYLDPRPDPTSDGTSGLSPWLHFGHLASHRVFADVVTQCGWTMRRLAAKASGQREGWWGAPPEVEAFLDQLVTWREVGFNFAALRSDHAEYESLPDWARASLEAHAADKREHVYTLAQFERAETHDEVWNAAQRQLLQEGRMHNYLRMLWGKKILQWTRTPREALAAMLALNDRFALDGRDPNSYSGIFWVLGRYDRPWGRREVFGVIRYMSSDNTRRKLRIKNYLRTYGTG